jgi:mannosyltransferase
MPQDLELVELAYPALGNPERVDWVDYADRNAAADPTEVAADVRREAGSNGIFVVWMSEYRTLEGDCEALVNALGRGEEVVTEDSDRYYEPANVHWFPAGRAGSAASAGSADGGDGA